MPTSPRDVSVTARPGANLVLVVTRSASSVKSTQGVFKALPDASAYQLEIALPQDASDLEVMIEHGQPRFLLIDAELCAEFGSAVVRRLRRARQATDWILRWPEEAPRWVETIICSQARGGIAYGASPHQLARALGAVRGGELWFSRKMATLVYEWLLNAARAVPVKADGGLTAREAEVLALVTRGLTNKQIAEQLDISVNTVKKHLAHAFEKRGLHRWRQVLG